MALLNLFICEIYKLKRSLALLMAFLCPLTVVLLQFIMAWENGGEFIALKGWNLYWMGATTLWYNFMLPLYIALITCLICSIEHKNNGWRLMGSLPINIRLLFIVKCSVASLFVILSSIILFILTWISIFILSIIGFQGTDMVNFSFLEHALPAVITGLPIIVIGIIIGWNIKNMVAPLVVGVIMTMTAMSVSHSPKYWAFDPWTYPLIGAMVSDDQVKLTALYLGLGVGLSLLVIASLLSTRSRVFET
ncbi:hypothetical protein D5R81_17975 [Parashewanella spongiae]|uniref:ABC transporter permease n=1 Tax=Parashewanella spongiae TaxID=342950 RepID=A0A3A6T9Y1_9GAMM|nr:ABC transporter permease [Parashewanella spongiae]MCL1079933.1 ABC transporter permease [Parashewanella spongiae]RJY06206.1 hypothetical protein D5R81_17975 [Parashewanella spongiae]